MMLAMGFERAWVDFIVKYLSTISYSVILNGNSSPPFGASRGLSPYLFLMCSEGLSALLKQATAVNKGVGTKISRNSPTISHLLFAYDIVLFGSASIECATIFKSVLAEYESVSRQCINFSKSTVFFSPNTRVEEKNAVISLLGVRESLNAEKYLGLQNFVRKGKRLAFQSLKRSTSSTY